MTTADDGTTGPPGGRHLNGWKEIASYLGKSVRSVQRWEVTLGLPVRRIRTRDGVIIYADADEIETWRRVRGTPHDLTEDLADPDQPPAPSSGVPAPATSDRPRSARRVWALASTVVLLLAAGFAIGQLSGNADAGLAVEIRYVGRTIEAIGRDGSVAWTYRFDADVSAPGGRSSLFLDLDGDGENEVIVPVRTHVRGTQVGTSEALYCFSRSGALKWKYAPDFALSYGEERHSSPWEISDYTVSHGAAPRRLWVAYAHHTWWPGFVVEIDPSGVGRLVYAQAGRVMSVSDWPTAAGSFLAIGGSINELRGATVVLLPSSGAVASYPMQDGRPPCVDCPAGNPRRVLLVHGSELVDANNERFPSVTTMRPVGSSLKVLIGEGGGASVLMLNDDFSVQSLQFSDRYWAVHERFERDGRVDHPAAQCPELHKPRTIGEWTPDRGWSWQQVPPGRSGARTLVAGGVEGGS